MTSRIEQQNNALYLFGETLSEYLQGASYGRTTPSFDSLESVSLDFGRPDIVRRQRASENLPEQREGYVVGGFVTDAIESATGVDLGPIGAAAVGLTANVALGNPIGIALGLTNVAVAALTGQTISQQIGLTQALENPVQTVDDFLLNLPFEIENPATGQITTQSGRQAISDTQGEGRGKSDDLSFGRGPAPGFRGTTGRPSPEPVTVEQAPALAADAAVASDPAADAAAAEAAAAGQGVAPGGSAPSAVDDSPESGAGIGASQGSTAGQTGTGATGVASESGFGDPGPGVDSGTSSGVGSAGDDSGHASTGEGLAKHGGQIKGYQEGDLVEDDQADTQLDDLGLGPLGIVNDTDGTTGVADDLEMDLPDGSYVLNAEAVELAGVGPINTIIKKAIDLAIEDGVDLPNEIKTAEKVPIRISKKEAVFPEALVRYIGLTKLEKMNARGLRAREQRQGEQAPMETAATQETAEDLLAQAELPVV